MEHQKERDRRAPTEVRQKTDIEERNIQHSRRNAVRKASNAEAAEFGWSMGVDKMYVTRTH